jgi:hypothetical protein
MQSPGFVNRKHFVMLRRTNAQLMVASQFNHSAVKLCLRKTKNEFRIVRAFATPDGKSETIHDTLERLNRADEQERLSDLRTQFFKSENFKSGFSKYFDGVSLTDLSMESLDRLKLRMDLLNMKYFNKFKVGKLTDEDAKLEFRPVLMTADERIDARRELSSLIKTFPSQAPAFLRIIAALRLAEQWQWFQRYAAHLELVALFALKIDDASSSYKPSDLSVNTGIFFYVSLRWIFPHGVPR